MNSIQARIGKLNRRFFSIQLAAAAACVLLVILLVLFSRQIPLLAIFAGVAAIAALYSFVLKITERIYYIQEDKLYFTQLEHIVESSQHPDDDGVYMRAKNHRDKLMAAGNPYGTRVYEIIFREGEYAAETWEEFVQRRDVGEKEIITDRHRVLRNRNRKDYLKHLAGQAADD